ncbi:MAG: hypothetical protein IJL52_00555 [Clostridia bacterium]|nr:hypothetical protein [Clostridia bacterium]
MRTTWKKLLALCLALLLAVAIFAACGKQKTDGSADPAGADASAARGDVTEKATSPASAEPEPAEPTQPTAADTTEANPTEPDAPTEPEPEPTPATDPVPEKTADDIYSEVLQTYMDKWDASEDFIYREYAFHDIDEDGTDELIVHDGAGEMDRTYYFYTAKNGAAIHLGDCEGWHAALSDGDRCVTLRAGMNGEGVATRISIADDALLMDEGEAYTFPPTPDFGPDIEFTTY